MHNVVNNDDGQGGNQENPEDTLDDRDSGIATSATDGVDVVEKHDDDLAKAQRYRRQIVAFQAQRRPSDNQPCDSGAGRADKGSEQQRYHPTESAIAQLLGHMNAVVD